MSENIREQVLKTRISGKDLPEPLQSYLYARAEQVTPTKDATDIAAYEQQRLEAQAELSRRYQSVLRGCANDCWLRGVVKLKDRIVAQDGDERSVTIEPSVMQYCLPGGLMHNPPADEQRVACNERHQSGIDALDNFPIPEV